MLLRYKTIELNGNLVVFDYLCRQQLREVMDEPFVEIDMKNCDIIDSAGVELINKLRVRIKEKKGHLKITNVNPSIEEILKICGIAHLVEVCSIEKNFKTGY
jgi:anti-anti-sigma factor